MDLWIAKRVENAYQFALNDFALGSDEHLEALVLLAIEDIEYGKNIASVIERQVLKVRIFISILIFSYIFNLIAISNLKHFKTHSNFL